MTSRIPFPSLSSLPPVTEETWKLSSDGKRLVHPTWLQARADAFDQLLQSEKQKWAMRSAAGVEQRQVARLAKGQTWRTIKGFDKFVYFMKFPGVYPFAIGAAIYSYVAFGFYWSATDEMKKASMYEKYKDYHFRGKKDVFDYEMHKSGDDHKDHH